MKKKKEYVKIRYAILLPRKAANMKCYTSMDKL